MKKIISVLLCMFLLASFAAAEDNAFRTLQTIYDGGKNTVFSPVSLYAALDMAAEGAKGATRDELLSLISDASSGELKSANAVFAAPEITLLDAYTSALDAKFCAEHFFIDAAVVDKVNAWISEKTDGMIDRFMQTLPDQAGLILINAVAMDKNWRKPFDTADTFEEEFFTSGGSISVPMMHQTEHFFYAEKGNVQIICLPYENSALEMWIALPAEGEMPALLEDLAVAGMDYFAADAQSKEVMFSLPKIDVTDQNDLVETLKQLGINAAFTSEADFSGISETPLFISGITQKARILMDEKSTKAAAATMVMMAKGAMIAEAEPPVEMKVNRPYLFAVSNRETGAVCFAGVIENPMIKSAGF